MSSITREPPRGSLNLNPMSCRSFKLTVLIVGLVALPMFAADIFAGSLVSPVLIGGLTGLFGGDSFETSSNRSRGISRTSKFTDSTILDGGGSLEGSWGGMGSKFPLGSFEGTFG